MNEILKWVDVVTMYRERTRLVDARIFELRHASEALGETIKFCTMIRTPEMISKLPDIKRSSDAANEIFNQSRALIRLITQEADRIAAKPESMLEKGSICWDDTVPYLLAILTVRAYNEGMVLVGNTLPLVSRLLIQYHIRKRLRALGYAFVY